MSWPEVMKINNDLDEPLNFTNYIYEFMILPYLVKKAT